MKQSWFNLIRFFANNMFITNFIIIMILLIGFLANKQLRREVAPQVEADAVHVNIYHPTASAQEIEQDIIRPLEDIIQRFDVSVRYWSFANDSYGRIIVSLPLSGNLSDIRQKLIAALQNVSDVPNEARIVITEEGAQSIPIYYFSLNLKDEHADAISILQKEADILNKKIKRNPDVYTTETSGLLQKEIFVNVNPNKLAQYYISLQEIISSLFRRNINASEGILNIDNTEKILVTDAGFIYPLDITNAIIRSNFEKNVVSIGDIAYAEEGFERAFNDVFVNNTKAVFFGVRAKNGVNINILTENLDEILSEAERYLPQELELTVVERRAEAVDTILSFTQNSAFIGIFIVFLVLLLFLDLRTAFWTTASIPITIALLLITLYYINITMNIITLCGMITVLGMLVDHGIVISENIYRYREEGFDSFESVKRGVSEVFYPIFVTVITTVAAFMPLLLIQGTIGNLIRPLPIVVSLALIFSFIEALLFLPAHLMHIPTQKTQKKETSWFVQLKSMYGKVLAYVLVARYFVVLCFIALLMGTVALISNMFKGFVFMEPVGVMSLYVNLEATPGTDRKEMKKLVSEVTEIVKKTVLPHERTIIKEEIGKYHILAFTSTGFAPNRGQIAVYLSDIDQRQRKSEEILVAIEEAVGSSSQATNFTKVFYENFGLIPKTSSALNLRFLQGIGSESAEYIEAMTNVYEYIKTIDGVINPEHSSLEGKNKVIIEFDYIKMAQLGIDARIVSETLKIAISGFVPTSWRSYQEKIPYIVRLDPQYKDSIDQLQNLLIPNVFNRLIPLKTFTDIYEMQGREDILRSKGQRMVEISLDVDPEKTTPTLVSRDVLKYYETIKNQYPEVDLQTAGESVSIARAFEDFKLAFLIASILIYVILLLLFKEPSQPFIVLIAIPFGIIGSAWAFYLHGQTLSFMSLVGIVGLSGVVVNDSVVMVDFINKVVSNSENNKKTLIPLIVQGSQNRLKAVLLTTVTTVAGLLPSIYGLRGVADLIVPITTAIAYGLLFATLLTLILIPALYMINNDLKTLIFRTFKTKTS